MRRFSPKGLRQSQNSFVTDEAPIFSKWKLKLVRLGVGTRLGSDSAWEWVWSKVQLQL